MKENDIKLKKTLTTEELKIILKWNYVEVYKVQKNYSKKVFTKQVVAHYCILKRARNFEIMYLLMYMNNHLRLLAQVRQHLIVITSALELVAMHERHVPRNGNLDVRRMC